jgi:hypothetical protein
MTPRDLAHDHRGEPVQDDWTRAVPTIIADAVRSRGGAPIEAKCCNRTAGASAPSPVMTNLLHVNPGCSSVSPP